MSRSFPMFVVTMLVAGAMSANASVLGTTVHTSAFAGVAAAQGEDVAAKVKAALKADADLGAASEAVTVTGAGGVITLEGTVPSVQVRAKLGEFVMKVDGVTKLVNKLKLAKK